MKGELRVEGREGPIEKKLYNQIRNYLMTRLVIQNRHRTAPFVNITVEKFLTARSHYDKNKNKTWTIGIEKTKTYSTHGCAVVGLSEEMYQLTMLFIGEIR